MHSEASKPQKADLTNEQWLALLKGLVFHFVSFDAYLKVVEDRDPENGPPPGYRQAASYAFLIHLRALIDFFYPRGSAKATDVSVSDSFGNLVGGMNPGDAPAWCKPVRQRLDEMLAHITIGGGQGASNWSDYRPAVEPIYSLAEEFLRKTVPSCRSLLSQEALYWYAIFKLPPRPEFMEALE